MYLQGLADSERAVYEKRIEDLKEQINSLNALLLKLSK
jgi:uncharacterized protein (DUF2164 family)